MFVSRSLIGWANGYPGSIKTDRKTGWLAQEVNEIYTPLTHRPGIGHLRWELEDLAFRYTDPDSYKRIASYWMKANYTSGIY